MQSHSKEVQSKTLIIFPMDHILLGIVVSFQILKIKIHEKVAICNIIIITDQSEMQFEAGNTPARLSADFEKEHLNKNWQRIGQTYFRLKLDYLAAVTMLYQLFGFVTICQIIGLLFRYIYLIAASRSKYLSKYINAILYVCIKFYYLFKHVEVAIK